MIDWEAFYAAQYSSLGVAAVLDRGTAGEVDCTVIDLTAGVQVGEDLTVATIKPAADIRETELAMLEVTREDLRGLSITFGETTWLIHHTQLRPSPAGAGKGELRLILEEAPDA